jgi:DNA invertase Pin-like site-specific DNA recombinase
VFVETQRPLNYIALKCKYLAQVCKLSGENSGIQDHRVERNKVMALAQARQIDAILVTELTRWGRNTMDLVHTLHTLQARGVSLGV